MNYTPLITQSVQKAIHTLLTHFQAQYGAMIFIPLGINEKTLDKIAPVIAQQIDTLILIKQTDSLYLSINDEKIEKIFDSFVNTFINSLNFITKNILLTLEMKMYWADFIKKLQEKKITDPQTHKKWKENLIYVLETIFTQIIIDLENQDISLKITNGIKNFNTIQEITVNLPSLQ